MTCNVCGAEIPAGAATCPVCGAPAPAADPAQGGYPMNGGAAPANPFGADPAANQAPMGANPYGGYDQPQAPFDPNQAAYDPYAQVAPNPGAAPKKSHTGLIIGICCGVAVIAAVIIMWALGVFGGGSGVDGTYKFESAQAMGMTMDADTMKTFGIDVSDFYIKINGDKATINLMGSGGDCDVKIDGSSITFSSSTQTISGTYDSGAGTITVEAGGATMVFKK